MNVGLPGGGQPATSSLTDFWIVIGGMIVVLALMIAYFRKRGWL
jgi:LPXTG-motif cell wall-anchored protein